MKLNKIHHIAIIVSNYEKSKDFYVNILGFTIINEIYRKERDSYKLNVKVGENDELEIFSFPNPPKRLSYPEATGLRHLAFEVEDLEKTIEELTTRGVIVENVRIDQETNKKFTFFQDPDGLPIELYQR